MNVCQQCGASVAEGLANCPTCGAEINPVTATGTELDAHAPGGIGFRMLFRRE